MMKKLNSAILMVVMMVAALSFTACGSNDDIPEGGGTITEASVVFKYNGLLYNYPDYGITLTPRYLPKETDGADFILSFPIDNSSFKINLPRNVYGDVPSSYFKVGTILDTKVVIMSFTDMESGTQIATYNQGISKVTANDGNTISIYFEDFKVSSTTRELHFTKGTIKFKIVDDYK